MSPRRRFNQGIRKQNIFANRRRARACLLVGLGIAVSVPASVVCVQGTAGNIFGHGPAGSDVVAVSTTGAQRHATNDAKGRYSISHVQMGTYSATLQKDGSAIDTRKKIDIFRCLAAEGSAILTIVVKGAEARIPLIENPPSMSFFAGSMPGMRPIDRLTRPSRAPGCVPAPCVSGARSCPRVIPATTPEGQFCWAC